MHLTRRLAREPQPFLHVGTQVDLMLAQEVRRPVRVRPAEQRIAVPPLEVQVERGWDCRVGKHGAQHGQDLFLYGRVCHGLDAA